MSGFDSTAAEIAQVALSDAGSLSLIDSGFFSDFTLYAVNTSNTSGWTDGEPQDFIGMGAPDPSVTPEPSSILLLGTGLLGVAGVVRRRHA